MQAVQAAAAAAHAAQQAASQVLKKHRHLTVKMT